MKRVFGLDRGFEHYDDTGIQTVRGRLARHVTDAALTWLDTVGQQRFFLFLNYYDPPLSVQRPGRPLPRVPAAGGRGRVTHAPERGTVATQAMYDGEIRYMDEHIGRLFDAPSRPGPPGTTRGSSSPRTTGSFSGSTSSPGTVAPSTTRRSGSR